MARKPISIAVDLIAMLARTGADALWQQIARAVSARRKPAKSRAAPTKSRTAKRRTSIAAEIAVANVDSGKSAAWPAIALRLPAISSSTLFWQANPPTSGQVSQMSVEQVVHSAPTLAGSAGQNQMAGACRRLVRRLRLLPMGRQTPLRKNWRWQRGPHGLQQTHRE